MAGRGSVMVMPDLAEYISEELAKEAAINKNRVKAHELRGKIKALAKAKPGDKDS